MKGLVKGIIDFDCCWMCGSQNNRWIFATMDLTIQIHQFRAYRQNRPTWNIKDEVLE
jgi:hypothetical protein